MSSAPESGVNTVCATSVPLVKLNPFAERNAPVTSRSTPEMLSASSAEFG